MTDSGKERLRVYYVSHKAMTKVTNVVAARSAREAVEKDEAGDHLNAGWASDGWPVSRGVARWARGVRVEDEEALR